MRRLEKIGFATVLAYAILFYLPQFTLHLLVPDLFNVRFAPFQALPYAIFIPIFFFLVFALQNVRVEAPVCALFAPWRLGLLFTNLAVVLPIALLHLAASLELFRNYGFNIRYKEEGLRGTSPLVVMAFFTVSYVRVWLLYHYAQIIAGHTTPPKHFRWIAGIFGTGSLLAINGSLEILYVATAFALAFIKPTKIRDFFVKEDMRWIGFRKVKLREVMVWLVLPAMLIGMIYFGYVNKVGTEGADYVTTKIGYTGILLATVVRVSTSYFSVVAFATNHLFDMAYYGEIYSVPLDRFWYRLSLILSPTMPMDRPDFLNIGRLNLLNYSKIEDAYWMGPVGGASPGMVASGFYLAPFPIGFILMALFVVLFARLLNGIMPRDGAKARLFLPLFFLQYLNTVVESPIDDLAIDPSLLFSLFTFIALIALRNEARAHRRDAQASEANSIGPKYGPAGRSSNTQPLPAL